MAITLKAGTGYDAPWITIDGLPGEQREEILMAFGLTESTEAEGRKVSDMTLAELACVASALFAGYWAGKGSPWQGRSGRSASAPVNASQGASTAKAQAAKPEPKAEDKTAGIKELIEAAQSLDDLKVIARDYGNEVKGNKELLAAIKARNTSLSSK